MDATFTFIPDEYEYVENYTESQCFGCGSQNPHGLHMQYYRKDHSLVSKVMLPDYLCGWSSHTAHGGILCFLLDEIMGMTSLVIQRCFVVTKTIEVNWIKSVSLREPITARAIIVNDYKNKIFTVEGGLYDKNNELCASGEAKYLKVTPNYLHEHLQVPQEHLDGITELIFKDIPNNIKDTH